MRPPSPNPNGTNKRWSDYTEEEKYAHWSWYVDTAVGPVLDYSTFSDLLDTLSAT